MHSKVGILLATYNGAKYIETQIESLLNQTYDNWQLLISDDGSTDETQKIISNYAERCPEKIRILSKEKPIGNAKGNFMFLTRMAEDLEYIMYCDQDDYWFPQKVELTLAKMKEIENDKNIPCLVHSDLEVVDGEMGEIAASFFGFSNLDYKRDKLNNLLVQNIVTGCTMMINRALWQMAVKADGFEKILMHDWYFALIASAFGKIGFVNKPLIKYRQHGNNSVGAKNAKDSAVIAEKISKKADIKLSIDRSMQQAEFFLEAFEQKLDNSQKKLLKGYASLVNKGKFRRNIGFIKYKTWKFGIIKKTGQLLYG